MSHRIRPVLTLLALSLALASCIEDPEFNNPLVIDQDGDGLLGLYDCDDSDPAISQCEMGDFCAHTEQCGGQGECVKGVCECPPNARG